MGKKSYEVWSWWISRAAMFERAVPEGRSRIVGLEVGRREWLGSWGGGWRSGLMCSMGEVVLWSLVNRWAGPRGSGWRSGASPASLPGRCTGGASPWTYRSRHGCSASLGNLGSIEPGKCALGKSFKPLFQHVFVFCTFSPLVFFM